MPTNDFIGFAAAGSANVMSQADYAAAAEQADGVQPGPASSALANKVWRQGANMAAALGALASAQGQNTLDDGDIATLAATIGEVLQGTVDTITPVAPSTKNYKFKFPNGAMAAVLYDEYTTNGLGNAIITLPEAFVYNPVALAVGGLGCYTLSFVANTPSSVTFKVYDSSGSSLANTTLRIISLTLGRWY